MILPTKHLKTEQSLLGVGALLLARLRRSMTVSGLWEAVKAEPSVGSYPRFILALDLLYALDAIELQNGFLMRRRRR
jgi:hypothetical protein